METKIYLITFSVAVAITLTDQSVACHHDIAGRSTPLCRATHMFLPPVNYIKIEVSRKISHPITQATLTACSHHYSTHVERRAGKL